MQDSVVRAVAALSIAEGPSKIRWAQMVLEDLQRQGYTVVEQPATPPWRVWEAGFRAGQQAAVGEQVQKNPYSFEGAAH